MIGVYSGQSSGDMHVCIHMGCVYMLSCVICTYVSAWYVFMHVNMYAYRVSTSVYMPTPVPRDMQVYVYACVCSHLHGLCVTVAA